MNRVTIVLVALVAVVVAIGWRASNLLHVQRPGGMVVGLIYDRSADDTGRRGSWDAYAAEQGVPIAWIPQNDATLIDPASLVAHYSALMLPDGLDTRVSEDLAQTLAAYVRGGGTLVVVNDAGTRTQNGLFTRAGALDALLGLRTVRFTELGKNAFGTAPIRFADAAAARDWHVPAGKLDVDLSLTSYHYGPLRYGLPATYAIANDLRVIATSRLGPAITERRIGRGRAIYVGLPIGYLRGRSDGFPLHALARRAIFDLAETPHLVAAPDARGALIINWHIDANEEWKGIPNLLARGLLRHDIRYDFDVTAGPDVLVPGDDAGFDACGKGARFLRMLEPYGTIGSHGGWLHNGFALGIEHHTLDAAAIKKLVVKNDACLQRITGYPMRDYAAPDGAHPQPLMTKIIESLGHVGYYYAGDTGAPAERAIFDGVSTSDRVWAFPIQPAGKYASVAELARAHVDATQTRAWLDGALDTVERDRTISLVYSHSYDMRDHPAYVPPFDSFLDRYERDLARGAVATTTMSEAADFLNRFVRATFSFARENAGVRVRLHDDGGLHAIAFALPVSWHLKRTALPEGLRDAGSDAHFHYYTVVDGRHDLDVIIPTEHP